MNERRSLRRGFREAKNSAQTNKRIPSEDPFKIVMEDSMGFSAKMDDFQENKSGAARTGDVKSEKERFGSERFDSETFDNRKSDNEKYDSKRFDKDLFDKDVFAHEKDTFGRERYDEYEFSSFLDKIDKSKTSVLPPREKKSDFEEVGKDKFRNKSAEDRKVVDAKQLDEQKNSEHNQLFLEFVIDGTLSFSKIFVPVYRALENAVYKIEEAARDVGDITVKYGLTVLGDYIKMSRYDHSAWYVANKDAFLESVKDITFTGGSLDGREDINNGIECALKKLENSTPAYANRAIIVFTDSVPKNEQEDVYFDQIPDCPNRGIRFALVYLGTSDYYGFFKLVDRNGNEGVTGKNAFSEVRCISELLGDDSATSIRNLIYRLVYQTSIR